MRRYWDIPFNLAVGTYNIVLFAYHGHKGVALTAAIVCIFMAGMRASQFIENRS